MSAPLPVFAQDCNDPLVLLYKVPVDATISDIRSAIEAQVTGEPFEFLGADGRTPLHPMQERILRSQDVWGASEQVRLRWVAAREPNGKGWHIPIAWWPVVCFVLPLIVAAAATVLSLGIGIFGLVLANLVRPTWQRSASSPSDPTPADDYQYYLDTFRKVWLASLDALVNMIDTYLNGPATILCNMGPQIISTVRECMLLYLRVFQHCFEYALNPEFAPMFIGVAVVAFLGTALVMHVVMRDFRRWLPWPPRSWLVDNPLEAVGLP
mmetsp:Transcript_133890/g.338298  ORF Transcript_133890/g.338298 Transcript_133890/m.338298 type:complete len:267 (+) Transcript_133890:72-872(+)